MYNSTSSCLICKSGPYGNHICSACQQGANDVISLVNKVESDKVTDKSKPQSNLANVSTWVNNLKDAADEIHEKINFLSGSASLFKQQNLSDIQLKPGKGGSCIPAHRAILIARSEIFKRMLNSEFCRAPPRNTLPVPELDHEQLETLWELLYTGNSSQEKLEYTLTFPELDHEELETLLEFLYTGNLPQKKLEKHVFCLTIAAGKYEIPYLLKVCERQIIKSLNLSNALNVLDMSQVCSNVTLKDAALSFIVRYRKLVVFSKEFEAFVRKNPDLAVQITRAICKK